MTGRWTRGPTPTPTAMVRTSRRRPRRTRHRGSSAPRRCSSWATTARHRPTHGRSGRSRRPRSSVARSCATGRPRRSGSSAVPHTGNPAAGWSISTGDTNPPDVCSVAATSDEGHCNGGALRQRSGAEEETNLSIIAWLVVGAIAGYLAGLLVKGDEGLGVIGHIVLGIVGAVVGGFLFGLITNTNPIDGPLDISSIVTAVIGAIIVVVIASMVMGRSRSGRGAV